MATFKTPLRYPGGKQRLWPFIYEILLSNGLVGGHYAEPYAGGAGVAIELLLRGLVSRVHLNDSCKAVFAFWHSIINEPERFCRKISRASLTITEWKRQREIFKNRATADLFDLGFALFYLNRCNRSGILTGGVIGGLEQKGEWKMDARFPRNDLITRVEVIADHSHKIKIRNWDAERFLTTYVPRLSSQSLVYCDAPYFHKADRLYPNYYKTSDHDRVAQKILQLTHPWVVSYDSCEEISTLYREARSFEYQLRYSAATSYQGSELFVFSDCLTIPEKSDLPSITNGLLTLDPRAFEARI